MDRSIRIAPLDRARTLMTLLVLLHHSVLNYTYFGHGDAKRWLGFDLVVLFDDSFFMAFMFLISGLFVHGEWTRKGSAAYLRSRDVRLGVPFLVSIFVLMPVAYYPTFLRYHLPDTTDFGFLHFWWRTLTVGPWPSGPAWFLWVLLAFDTLAAALLAMCPGAIRMCAARVLAMKNSPTALFASFVLLTLLAYVPLRVIAGDANWLAFGPLPIQTSRILLYGGSFFVGVIVGATDLRGGVLAQDGALAQRWPVWSGFAACAYTAILALVSVRHTAFISPDAAPLQWHVAYSIAFALFSASMAFVVFAVMLRWSRRAWPLLDALQPSAYGIYLAHYVFIIWLQYAIYDFDWPAMVKFAVVFTGTLSLSWLVALALRRMPGVRSVE